MQPRIPCGKQLFIAQIAQPSSSRNVKKKAELLAGANARKKAEGKPTGPVAGLKARIEVLEQLYHRIRLIAMTLTTSPHIQMHLADNP